MRRKSIPLLVGLLMAGLATSAPAQISNLALGEAKARLACGAGVVVASVFLPNGSLQVTCARNPVQSSTATTAASSTVVQATGLTAPVAIATVGVATLLVVIVGGGDTGTTTDSSAEASEPTDSDF